MRAYEEYSTTQEICFPIIPSHWSMWKIKHLFSERIEKGFPKEQLLVASQNHGVIPKQEYGARTVEATKDLHLLKLVKKGDFVISLRSFQGGIEYAYSQGIISPAYTIMVPEREILPSYFRLLAKSFPFIEVLKQCVTGIREGQNVDYYKLKNRQIPLPPRDEQDALVRFLDAKCAKIDRLIKLKERQIALLNEKKQIMINQAVTRGLDPNVPMKDSGVDWIGEIPEGWEVLRCKYLFTETNFRSEKGEETHLSMSQRYGLVPDSMMEERRMLSESYAGGKLCSKNDIVLNRLKAHLGVFALASQDGVISPDYTVFSINKKKILPSYAEYILKCHACRRELVIRVRGIVNGFLRLYTEDFNTLKLPIPAIEEQKKIIEFISQIEHIAKSKVEVIS